MNGFLVHKHKNKISEWIGGDSRFELLYKLSRDGGSTKMFHELCDNKGPTVTIFYNTDNNVHGGYLSDSWGRSGGWCTDQRAFLFTLYSAGHWKPIKFPHIDGETHFQTFNRGPCFYSLNSFHMYVKMEKKIPSNFYKCITTGLFDGQRFDMKGETAQSVANDHNNVTDMEVYLVKDGLPDEELQIPWRDSTEWNNKGFQELKEFIATYEPFAEMKIPEVNILLIGQAGAGKSSLFNTFNSIFKGGISSRACSGSAEKGITQKFDKLRIRDPSTKKYLRFRICDTCGVKDRINIKNEDIGFIMDGNLPNHYTFDHETGASIKSPGFVKEPTMRDKIHVVVFILDGSNLNFLSYDVVKKLQEIKSLAIDRGVSPLVFLTKIDEICELVRDDVSKVYNSKIVEDAVNKAADLFAIPRLHVLPVKNYEKESELLTCINILALTALRKSLMFADDFLENQYELKQEKMETLNKQD
ncbi:interferon-induced protein 44 isoform X2 [Magallana gigas]|uniref:interferon-induced protein 44 isoform X2 n=1 Tax=Magallana gigas TaxID=29159 RepID=UPI0033403333